MAFCISQNTVFILSYCLNSSDKFMLLVLPVLAETAQNSACISFAILAASFSVLCLSSKGLRTRRVGTREKLWISAKCTYSAKYIHQQVTFSANQEDETGVRFIFFHGLLQPLAIKTKESSLLKYLTDMSLKMSCWFSLRNEWSEMKCI